MVVGWWSHGSYSGGFHGYAKMLFVIAKEIGQKTPKSFEEILALKLWWWWLERADLKMLLLLLVS